MGSRIDNTIIVIPSYNESRTIGGLVGDVVKRGMSVLVIDDGSDDNTAGIALDNGAMVTRHKKNSGKGFAIRDGINYVSEKTSFEWIILMDADGQHRPEDIRTFMDATRDEEFDIVTGNRMLDTRTMPALRYWTNRFMSWILSSICGQYIPDTQCGYRLIRVDILKGIELISERYDIESEILLQAARRKAKMKSVPVQTIYGKEISRINPSRDAIRFCALIIKYYLSLFKRPGSK